MDLKSTYNKIAEHWHNNHKTDDWWVKGTDKFISFLKPGSTILDVGCGAGTKAKYLVKKGFKVFGIDFSEKMIEIAKREVPQGEFSVQDIYNLKDFDKTFDAIFAQAVLLHIPKLRVGEVLKTLVGKLNKGGYLYVGVKQMQVGGKEEDILVEDDYGFQYERFFSYFTSQEIESYFKKAGLIICYTDVTDSGKTTWIQTIGKLP